MTDAHIIKFAPPPVSKLPPLQGKSKAFNAALDAVGGETAMADIPYSRIDAKIMQGIVCFQEARHMASYNGNTVVENAMQEIAEGMTNVAEKLRNVMQPQQPTPPKGAA